jgi:hypothetical protein
VVVRSRRILLVVAGSSKGPLTETKRGRSALAAGTDLHPLESNFCRSIRSSCRRPRSPSRSQNATLAPSATKRLTVASPIPDAPPVTAANLPLSLPMFAASHCITKRAPTIRPSGGHCLVGFVARPINLPSIKRGQLRQRSKYSYYYSATYRSFPVAHFTAFGRRYPRPSILPTSAPTFCIRRLRMSGEPSDKKVNASRERIGK